MKVGMFVDDFSTIDSTPEKEYEEIEASFREALPDVKFKFKRNVSPYALSNSDFDVYLFDFGGLAYADMSGSQRMSMAREIAKQAEERPSTLFIPYTKMTRDYQNIAADDAFGDFSPPNLWRPDIDDWDTEPVKEALQRWESSKKEAAAYTTFFDPKPEFMEWLKKLVNDRPVVDVGCGNCRLIRRMHHIGIKAMGIDSQFEYEKHPDMTSCVLACDAETCSTLKDYPMLVLFCRPCHSGFVADTIENIHPDSEILYFSKPANLKTDIPSKWRAEVLDCPGLVEETGYRIHRTKSKKPVKTGKLRK